MRYLETTIDYSAAARTDKSVSHLGLRSVRGWLNPYNAEFIVARSNIQRRAGFVRSVGEIGVHHGKLFILLLLTAAENERALAIDVFENQHLNTDRSGAGDRDAFLSNVRRVGPAAPGKPI